jgi:hypothetical protein
MAEGLLVDVMRAADIGTTARMHSECPTTSIGKERHHILDSCTLSEPFLSKAAA